MKEINVQAVISEVESFNNKIGALKSKEELLKKTILSLKNTTQNIQNNTCPFDQNLGNTLDFIVDFVSTGTMYSTYPKR